MSKTWCVVSCGAGEIFMPDFFETKENAIEYVKDCAEHMYECVSDMNEANIYISNDGMHSTVNTDEYEWGWRAFDCSKGIL